RCSNGSCRDAAHRTCDRGDAWLFFFFQAEDGIRDGHVTGVQTCALPISTGPRFTLAHAKASARLPKSVISAQTKTPTIHALRKRSEERRVGKECRYRWSREH